MPTPAEWIFIAFVVGVIFAFHRLRSMGDALGALLGKSEPPTAETTSDRQEKEPSPTDTP